MFGQWLFKGDVVRKHGDWKLYTVDVCYEISDGFSPPTWWCSLRRLTTARDQFDSVPMYSLELVLREEPTPPISSTSTTIDARACVG